MSEAKRGLIRVVTNYGRLLATLLIGLVTAPLLLHALGKEGAGLVAFLTSVVAVSELSQRILEASMVRELSAAYHSGDRDWFRSVYNSTVLICLGTAVAAVLVFVGIYFCLPLFNIDTPELLDAARWYVLARMVEIIVVIVVTPQFNYYLAVESMVAYNLNLTLRRLCYLIAAVSLLGVHHLDPAWGVKLYAVISAGLMVISCLVVMVAIFWREPDLVPRLSLVRRRAMSEVMGVGGWNAAVLGAMIMPESIAQLIMNWKFGLVGNLIWGYAFQLSGYIRMVTSGMTTGLSSVAARFQSQADAVARLRTLVFYTSRTHGVMALPALVALTMLAEPIIRVWVGNRPNFPPDEVGRTVALVRILAVAWGLRSIADGWMAVLYGAGYVRQYAPWLLVGGVLNPLLALLLVTVLPTAYAYTGPAWAFAVILSGFFFLGLAWMGAPLLKLRKRELFEPLKGPLIDALATGAIILPYVWNMDVNEPRPLLMAGIAYAAIYGVICWMWLLTAEERRQLLSHVGVSLERD